MRRKIITGLVAGKIWDHIIGNWGPTSTDMVGSGWNKIPPVGVGPITCISGVEMVPNAGSSKPSAG